MSRGRDALSVGILVLALGYGGAQAEAILVFILPLVLTGLVYDAQRYYPVALRGQVHVAAPYLLEKRLFGIRSGGRVLTLNEWSQLHTSVGVDLLTGFCYLVLVRSE